MKTIKLYSDGACSGNPGPGGYCAILRFNEHEKVVQGGAADTTNNRMEMMAVIAALEALNEPCNVELYSDSKYVIDTLQKGWAKSWRSKGWKKSDGKPALNADLWDRLLSLSETHHLDYHWIKGHSGHPMNERCDEIAVIQSQKYKK